MGKNYHIFCDNFFTSVRLAEDFLSDKLYLCGTTLAKLSFVGEETLLHLCGRTRKPCTQCDARGAETVRRKQKDGTYIEAPSLKLYNQCMGRVDHSNQMRQYYDTSRKAIKWWRYLLWFCLDVSVTRMKFLRAICEPKLAGKHIRISFHITNMCKALFFY
ncbi:hypothetical protein pdam_00002382 [Pocillopora damicornis]|uniref:PiggyBac transposable element-derived protein domain-containing protein n=1 Tax=Pocillopora damicornis TaxID=46731 RepID=A0A3M6USI5_POCDA|nr:hypothetical protein pdam_00002382 [Pocillopora damicornis]